MPLDDDQTGARTWGCSILMAACITERPSGPPLCVVGKRILELGAGTGELSVALVRAGAVAVIATDLPHRVPALAERLRTEGVGDIALARPLQFGDIAAARAISTEMHFDAVVATEILYWPALDCCEEDILAPLCATLAEICGRAGCPALLVYKVREAERESEFVAMATAAGFGSRLLPPSARASSLAVCDDPDPSDGPSMSTAKWLMLTWRGSELPIEAQSTA